MLHCMRRTSGARGYTESVCDPGWNKSTPSLQHVYFLFSYCYPYAVKAGGSVAADRPLSLLEGDKNVTDDILERPDSPDRSGAHAGGHAVAAPHRTADRGTFPRQPGGCRRTCRSRSSPPAAARRRPRWCGSTSASATSTQGTAHRPDCGSRRARTWRTRQLLVESPANRSRGHPRRHRREGVARTRRCRSPTRRRCSTRWRSARAVDRSAIRPAHRQFRRRRELVRGPRPAAETHPHRAHRPELVGHPLGLDLGGDPRPRACVAIAVSHTGSTIDTVEFLKSRGPPGADHDRHHQPRGIPPGRTRPTSC